MSAWHPFHVSVCEMKYNAPAQRLEIIHKIFWDDLEDGLSQMTGKRENISSPTDSAYVQGLIQKYLDTHFVLSIEGQKLDISFVGAELEEDAFWCYQMVSDLPSFSSIRVQNKLLMEVFDDQMNLIHLEHMGKTKSLRLTRRKFEDQLSW
jgi:hypothetical protein